MRARQPRHLYRCKQRWEISRQWADDAPRVCCGHHYLEPRKVSRARKTQVGVSYYTELNPTANPVDCTDVLDHTLIVCALVEFSFHKVSVECLDFSCDGKFLASLGGESCNTLVLWSVEERKALCRTAAALDSSKCLTFYNKSPNMLVSGPSIHSTEPMLLLFRQLCQWLHERRPLDAGCLFACSAGASHVRIWEIDAATKKMTPRDCNLGKLRRTCNSLVLHPADEFVYCGTQSGKTLSPRDCGGQKFKKFSQHLQVSVNLPNSHIPSCHCISQGIS